MKIIKRLLAAIRAFLDGFRIDDDNRPHDGI